MINGFYRHYPSLILICSTYNNIKIIMTHTQRFEYFPIKLKDVMPVSFDILLFTILKQ